MVDYIHTSMKTLDEYVLMYDLGVMSSDTAKTWGHFDEGCL